MNLIGGITGNRGRTKAAAAAVVVGGGGDLLEDDSEAIWRPLAKAA